MKAVLIALLLTTALPTAGSAQDKRPAKPAVPPAAAPALKQTRGNPCAAYGPGFVQVEGGGTCVKIGGALEVGVGGSGRR